MASTIIGKVAVTPKGAYNVSTSYVRLDLVTYNGSSYICLKNCTGVSVTNTEYWQLVAQKGDTPINGVDYNTTAEKEELKHDVIEQSKVDLEDFFEEQEQSFESSLLDYSDDLKTDFNTNATSKTETFDSNASAKTSAFNDNASAKTNEFNQNATNKTTTFNANVTSKTETFDNNATSKTTTFNENATNKTETFNSNVSNKVTEFNNNATTKTNEFNQNAESYNARITELEEIVVDDENVMLKGTANGESIDLEDSAGHRVKEIQLFGNSVQETSSYKGLLKIPKTLNQTINGLSFMVNNDGSVTIFGTATQNVTIDLLLEKQLELNGTYTFSLKATDGLQLNQMQWILYAGTISNKVNLNLNPAVESNVTKSVTNTVNNTATILRIFAVANRNFNGTVYPILEQGSVVTDWNDSPTIYTPNSDYPQEINSCGDSGSIKEKIVNKNFYDKENINWFRNNSSDFSNETNNNSERIRTSSFKLKGGKTYTISGLPDNIFLDAIRTFDKNQVYLQPSNVTINNLTFTLSDAVEYIHVLLRGTGFTNETNIMMKNADIQIEEGSTSTSYLEHKSQTYIIPTQKPFRKIENVRDTFIKENGVWYEKHNIKYIESYNGEIIDTNYISTTGELSIGAGVQYILNTPELLECTAEQVEVFEQLQKAKTYKNVTHIYSEDEVAPYVETTYYKDLETVINNIDTRVSTIESEE